MQVRQVLEPQAATVGQRMLSQNVPLTFNVTNILLKPGCRCESCIDRLFTLGPAPCPICNKILRKLAFTPQTFEDLTVEKEVAIRRRIAKECVLVSYVAQRSGLTVV